MDHIVNYNISGTAVFGHIKFSIYPSKNEVFNESNTITIKTTRGELKVNYLGIVQEKYNEQNEQIIKVLESVYFNEDFFNDEQISMVGISINIPYMLIYNYELFENYLIIIARTYWPIMLIGKNVTILYDIETESFHNYPKITSKTKRNFAFHLSNVCIRRTYEYDGINDHLFSMYTYEKYKTAENLWEEYQNVLGN